MEGWSLSEAKVPARAFLYSGSLIGYQSCNQGGAVLEEGVTADFSLAKRQGLQQGKKAEETALHLAP